MQSWFADIAFPILFSSAVARIGLWVGASIVYRKSRGKSLFSRKPQDAVFFESNGPGHSNRNLLIKPGGARNCLSVAVTKEAVLTQPRFPFSLMFFPELYDLEHKIQRRHLRSVTPKKVLFGRSVELDFTTVEGESRSIEPCWRGLDRFLEALTARRACSLPSDKGEA
jgi:hypothetical protein